MVKGRFSAPQFLERASLVAFMTLTISVMDLTRGFAEDAGDLEMRAIAADRDSGGNGVWLVLLVLVGTILLFNTWYAFSERRRRNHGAKNGPRRVENLFLGIQTQPLESTPLNNIEKPNAEKNCSYLRSLSLDGAELVSSFPCSISSMMAVQLASLPDFPTAQARVNCEVLACRRIEGDPPSYSILLKFRDFPESARLPLDRYLTTLSGKSGPFIAGSLFPR